MREDNDLPRITEIVSVMGFELTYSCPPNAALSPLQHLAASPSYFLSLLKSIH